MRFSSVVYEPIPDLATLTARLRIAADLRYDGIELSATHPLGFAVEDAADAADRVGLPVVSLLSGWSYANEGLCLSSPDTRIRDRTVERLVEYVDVAAGLGAIVVVGLLQGLRSDEPDADVANERIAAALVRVAAAAEDAGVAIALEPVNHLQVGFNHTAADMTELIARIGSPAVGLMLDTIHLNIEERSILDTIRAHGEGLLHVHLADTTGAGFGSGNLDFEAVLETLAATGYDRYISTKVYREASWEEGARSSMAFLRDLGVVT